MEYCVTAFEPAHASIEHHGEFLENTMHSKAVILHPPWLPE
jgi:hypothetical protein